MGRQNKSALVLLGVLTLGPQSGYEIKKWIEKSIGHFWQEGYAQIYPNLKKLVNDGLATVQVEKQERRPDKKIYTLTAKGKERFQEWLKSPIPHLPKEKHEILLKLFFGRHADIEDNLAHVYLYKERMNVLLSNYQCIEKLLLDEKHSHPDQTYQLITVRSGILNAQAALTWCDETIHILYHLKAKEED